MRRNMCKRIGSLAAALALCLGLLFPAAPAARAAENSPRTLYISTAAELALLSKDCTLDAYSRNLTVVLTADIDLSGVEFAPIPVFCGDFNGAGHTVSGFSFTEKGSDQGFIRYLQAGAVVRDLTLEGTLTPGGSKSSLGLIAGENSGTISGCTVSGTVTGDEDVGGIAGCNTVTGRIAGCVSQASVTGELHTGGIAGSNQGVIENCTGQGQVNITENENAMDTGGIAGYSSGTVTGCVNHSAVGYQHTGYNTGGIAGRQKGVIENCQNHGVIQGRKDIGGIVGQFEPDTNLIYGQDPTQALSNALGGLTPLLSQLTAQVSSAGSSVSEEVSAINTALGSITDTAHTSGTQGADHAKTALDTIYWESQKINSALGSLIEETDSFRSDAHSALTGIDNALSDLRKAVNSGITGADDELDTTQSLLSFYLDAIEGDLTTLQKGLDSLAASLEKLRHFQQRLNEISADNTMGPIEKLAAIHEAVELLNGFDLASPISTISGALKDIFTQAGFIRDRLELSEGNLSDLGDQVYKQVNKALDDLSTASTTLENKFNDFSDGAADRLSAVNTAVNVIEDTLSVWYDQTDTGGRAAFDSIDTQLDTINTHVTSLNDQLSASNASITATTNAIIAQLDAVRLAASGLKETPTKTVDDVSDDEEEASGSGRVVSCSNDAAVSGDANVGGITGIMALELDPDPEEDLDLDAGKLLVDTTAVIRATVLDCRNDGAVTAKNDCAGGIAGRGDLGAVLDCRSYGAVETTGGNLCGGIAGQARIPIRRCYALCDLTGHDDMGGIVGAGRDVEDCRAMVRIDSDGERIGAIAGGIDGTAQNNFFVRESLGGIDGVNYEGQAVSLPYEEFIALEGMPEEFHTLQVTFEADGQVLKTITVEYGGSVSPDQFPELPHQEGCSAAWEEVDTDNIFRSTVIHAVYTPLVSTISTGEAQPILLAEGSFALDASITTQDWRPDVSVPKGYQVSAGYGYQIDGLADSSGSVTLRLRCGEKDKAAILQDGKLVLVDGSRDGSYLVFSAPASGQIAVLSPTATVPLIVSGVAGGGVVVLVLLLLLLKRRSRKKSGEPAGTPS